MINSKNTILFIISFIFLLLPVNTTSADEEELHWYSGFSFMLGYSYRDIEFQVSDSTSLNELGIMAEKGDESPVAFVFSPYFYFSEQGNAGWYVDLSYSQFDLRHQKVNEEQLVDMGTSVHGSYFFATPVIFYHFGERPAKNRKGHSFKFGAGIGLGYLHANGNIILTETPSQRHINIDVDKFTHSINVLMDYQYGNFILRARGGGPRVDDGPIEYSIFEFAMDMGYIITF